MRRFQRLITAWYAASGRLFFWRKEPLSAFETLVTEMLLSRTRAASVEPVARAILSRWPTAKRMASADVVELETALFPLGLHRKRARMLLACARQLNSHGGEVVGEADELLALPYVGRYAATAVLCFHFGRKVAVVDANVARVYRRVFALPIPERELRRVEDAWKFAARMLPATNARAFNWALLDLGGTTCTPRSPRCGDCPVAEICAHGKGQQRSGRSRGV
jgi:A/G-specific adenine glycosylase